MNGRHSRGRRTAEAAATATRRGEKPCPEPHDTEAIRTGQPCPSCKAVI